MNITEHYRELFKKYGDGPEAVQWSNVETQEKRFEIDLYLISQKTFDDVVKQYAGGTKEAIEEVIEILKNEEMSLFAISYLVIDT